MTTTTQGILQFIPLDAELLASAAGEVTSKSAHVPDFNLIDAYNAMPTVGGYSSFFGKGEYLDEESLPSQSIQDIVTFRTLHGDNVQLAFCREGLYMRSIAGDATGVRTYASGATPPTITIDMPAGQAKWIWVLGPTYGPTSPWEIWTFPILDNEMYIYIQGLKFIYKLTSIVPGSVVFEELEPTYVIGTDDVYEFTLYAENDSDGDDTYKAVQIDTDAPSYMGNYTHYVHSASLVADSKLQIEAALGLGFSVDVTETARTITDIEAFIPIYEDYDEVRENLSIVHNGSNTDFITVLEGGIDPDLHGFDVDVYRVEFTHTNPLGGVAPNPTGTVDVTAHDYTETDIDAIYTGGQEEVLCNGLNNAGSGNYQCCYRKIMGDTPNTGVPTDGQATDTIYWEQETSKTAPQFTHSDVDVTVTVTKLTTPETVIQRTIGKTYPVTREIRFGNDAASGTWRHWDTAVTDEQNKAEIEARLDNPSAQYYCNEGYNKDLSSLIDSWAFIELADDYYCYTVVINEVNWGGIRAIQIANNSGGAYYLPCDYMEVQEIFESGYLNGVDFVEGITTPTLEYCNIKIQVNNFITVPDEIVDVGSTWQLTLDSEVKVFTISIGETKKEVCENFLAFVESFTEVAGIIHYSQVYDPSYQSQNDLAFSIAFVGTAITSCVFINLTGGGGTTDYGPVLYDNITIAADDAIKFNNWSIDFSNNTPTYEIQIGAYSTASYSIDEDELVDVRLLVADFNTNVGPHFGLTAYYDGLVFGKRMLIIPSTPLWTSLSSSTALLIYMKSGSGSNGFTNCRYGDALRGEVYPDAATSSFNNHAVQKFVQVGVRVTGFKTRELTELSVNGASYLIPFEYDSNDVTTVLAAKLAAYWTVGAIQVITAARAQVDTTTKVRIRIFDDSEPSLTLTQDGTTLWEEEGTGYDTEEVELLQVEGIYTARGRLGYWDRSNLIGWSAYDDKVDFVPSSETQANQVPVPAIKGKIVKCIGYENGFVIYATGNVIISSYEGGQYTFRAKPIDEAEGVVDPRHIAAHRDIHYYWGTKGLTAISPGKGTAELVLAEMADWINTFRYPITLGIVSNRYIIIYLQDKVRKFSNRDVRIGLSELDSSLPFTDNSPREISSAAHGSNLYPIYERALVLDTILGKWGTCDSQVFLLSSMSPINQPGYQIAKDYELTASKLHNLQTEILLIQDDSSDAVKCYIAIDSPATSYCLFGHYTTHRIRNSKVVALDAEFVDFPTAQLEIERSIDGATIEWDQLYNSSVTGLKSKVYPNITGKWLNALVKGTYNLKRLLIKGQPYGREQQ